MSATPPDEALAARIRARNADAESAESAFETLAARHRNALHRLLSGMVRDDFAADDLTQETLLRVWTRADQWDGRGSVKSWLFRIATNLALNHLRTRRRRREQTLSSGLAAEDDDAALPAWMADSAASGPDALAIRADERRRVRALLGELPEDKREVLRLVHDAEMELSEVAATLGIPEGTVKSRLFHARRRLARQWRDLDEKE